MVSCVRKAGGYCPIGSSYQQPCPQGTYNNFSGAADPADCSDCPPGFYCSGTSNPAPTGGCHPGHFCTGGASSPTQNKTERGYYAPTGAAVQYPCLPGYYNEQARHIRYFGVRRSVSSRRRRPPPLPPMYCGSERLLHACDRSFDQIIAFSTQFAKKLHVHQDILLKLW